MQSRNSLGLLAICRLIVGTFFPAGLPWAVILDLSLQVSCAGTNAEHWDAGDDLGTIDGHVELDSDNGASTCPVDWEHTPDPRVAPALEPAYYSRPFFTTCEDGEFFHSTWMSFDKPIYEYVAAKMARRIRCVSGRCKYGACLDDIEYIESLIPDGVLLEAGTVLISSEDCIPCNPNNAMFSVWDDVSSPANAIYDGGEWCVGGAMPHNGPCGWQRPGWTLGAKNGDITRGFIIQSYGMNRVCLDEGCQDVRYEQCKATEDVMRIQGTTSVAINPIDGSKCDSGTVGHIVYDGEIIKIDRGTITIGTNALMSTDLPPDMWSVSPQAMNYFTCSGVADIHTVEGRWFKAAWMFHYDPAKCDKPCWMAASGEALPVDFGMVELQGDPGI